jgi:hypothetical protein
MGPGRHLAHVPPAGLPWSIMPTVRQTPAVEASHTHVPLPRLVNWRASPGVDTPISGILCTYACVADTE